MSVLPTDGPTGNLDEDTGDEIIALLENCGGTRADLALVTHDSALGRRAQRLAVMRHGQLRMAGQSGGRATTP